MGGASRRPGSTGSLRAGPAALRAKRPAPDRSRERRPSGQRYSELGRRYPADRETGGEQRGETQRDRLAAGGPVAHERRGERHRDDEREPVQDVHALTRSTAEYQDGQPEHALQDRRYDGDRDRAAVARVWSAVTDALNDAPHPHERVIKDERERGPAVEREHKVHRPKARASPPML